VCVCDCVCACVLAGRFGREWSVRGEGSEVRRVEEVRYVYIYVYNIHIYIWAL